MRVRETIGVGLLFYGAAAAVTGVAQEMSPIGRVRVEDAQVTGMLEVSGGEAALRGAATVTARDHTAELRLERGGEVQVCQTSVVHATVGPRPADAPAPLLLALDRGAMQVHTAAMVKDALLTPDLRFSVTRAGLLNLGIRVVPNGDTCVENGGAGAPTLAVEEQLTGASYELRPGQHVLFERGSVREVVDHETSPCGCPPVTPAEQLAGTGGGGTVLGGAAPGSKTAEAEHPFPAAESQGLAPGGAVPQAAPGQVHAQVGATLAYGDQGTDSGGGMTPAPGGAKAVLGAGSGAAAVGGGAPGPAGTPAPAMPAPVAGGTAAPAPSTPTAAAPKAEEQVGVFRRIGRFFKHLLG